MRRLGQILKLRAEHRDYYVTHHAAVWPGVLAQIRRSNMRNYSIYLREPENLLFGYWEYTGSDYAADMQVLGERAITRKWLGLTDPCQAKLRSAGPDEWWSTMPEIYHLD